MHDIDEYLFDVFKNQYQKQLSLVQNLINKLASKTEYKDSINQLFRIFHNFKSSTAYLNLKTMHELIVEIENILEVLRSEDGPAQNEIIVWLNKVNTQLLLWQDEIQNDVISLSEIPEDLLNSIRLAPSKMNTKDKLKTLQLLYIDNNNLRTKKIIEFLEKISFNVKHLSSIQNSIKLADVDICIINISKHTLQGVEICQNKLPNSALLVITDKITQKLTSNLMYKGVSNFITNANLAHSLKRELYNITQSHFSGRRLLINNKKIYEFIQDLQPLSSSVIKIQNICNNEESSTKELAKAIKQDPILTSTILTASQSPIYGLKRIRTIDQAVCAFGKKTVKAIVFSGISKNIGNFDLEAYNINEEIYSKVASLLLYLMVHWYSKVSFQSLNTLSLSAILGNLGQLLLSKEIKKSGKLDFFRKESIQCGFQIAEEKTLHTNTTCVTSDILEYWKLDAEIIDSIRYSDRPSEAPLEIRELCIANHIVFNTVLLDGSINKELPKKTIKLIKKEKISIEPLMKSIQYISSI